MIFSFCSVAQSQILVNKFWQVLNANPASGIEWSASEVDLLGNIITTGNTVNSSGQVNLLVVKQSPSGQTLWQEEYSAGVDSKNYGIALVTDSNNNIYIAGATYNPVNQNHDYLILKYNSTGNLQWSHIENGTDNGEDIPAGIALDGSNNVFVTGASYGTSTDYDYLTIGLNASGTFNWKKRYDYNNLMDGAGALQVGGGYVRVTGGSASSITDWDYANLRYQASSGTLVSEFRSAAGGPGLEIPTAMAINSNNQMVVTGYGGNGQANDCYTILLDEDLDLLWEVWYDGGSGLDDRAFDVEIDSDGNIYICGYSEKSNGGKDFLLIKYDGNGTELWSEKRTALDRTNASKALFLEIDETHSHVLVSGEEFGEKWQ